MIRQTVKKTILAVIAFYRSYISPLKHPCCRFYPTCSLYAMQAVESYGIFRGCFLAFCRILRCNPFNPGGYDPVEDKAQVFCRNHKN